jgi:hypothetical protein
MNPINETSRSETAILGNGNGNGNGRRTSTVVDERELREVYIQWCREGTELFIRSRLPDGRAACARGRIVSVASNSLVVASTGASRDAHPCILRIDLIQSIDVIEAVDAGGQPGK